MLTPSLRIHRLPSQRLHPRHHLHHSRRWLLLQFLRRLRMVMAAIRSAVIQLRRRRFNHPCPLQPPSLTTHKRLILQHIHSSSTRIQLPLPHMLHNSQCSRRPATKLSLRTYLSRHRSHLRRFPSTLRDQIQHISSRTSNSSRLDTKHPSQTKYTF